MTPTRGPPRRKRWERGAPLADAFASAVTRDGRRARSGRPLERPEKARTRSRRCLPEARPRGEPPLGALLLLESSRAVTATVDALIARGRRRKLRRRERKGGPCAWRVRARAQAGGPGGPGGARRRARRRRRRGAAARRRGLGFELALRRARAGVLARVRAVRAAPARGLGRGVAGWCALRRFHERGRVRRGERTRACPRSSPPSSPTRPARASPPSSPPPPPRPPRFGNARRSGSGRFRLARRDPREAFPSRADARHRRDSRRRRARCRAPRRGGTLQSRRSPRVWNQRFATESAKNRAGGGARRDARLGTSVRGGPGGRARGFGARGVAGVVGARVQAERYFFRWVEHDPERALRLRRRLRRVLRLDPRVPPVFLGVVFPRGARLRGARRRRGRGARGGGGEAPRAPRGRRGRRRDHREGARGDGPPSRRVVRRRRARRGVSRRGGARRAARRRPGFRRGARRGARAGGGGGPPPRPPPRRRSPRPARWRAPCPPRPLCPPRSPSSPRRLGGGCGGGDGDAAPDRGPGSKKIRAAHERWPPPPRTYAACFRRTSAFARHAAFETAPHPFERLFSSPLSSPFKGEETNAPETFRRFVRAGGGASARLAALADAESASPRSPRRFRRRKRERIRAPRVHARLAGAPLAGRRRAGRAAALGDDALAALEAAAVSSETETDSPASFDAFFSSATNGAARRLAGSARPRMPCSASRRAHATRASRAGGFSTSSPRSSPPRATRRRRSPPPPATGTRAVDAGAFSDAARRVRLAARGVSASARGDGELSTLSTLSSDAADAARAAVFEAIRAFATSSRTLRARGRRRWRF